MASARGPTWRPVLRTIFLHLLLVAIMAEERRECREQEYKDQFGNCIACRHCDAGQELSKECGFGYGEDAQCVPCRASRFKEDRGLQKCKPCLDCALLNRFQKANCSSTTNAVCGDCLPGFYRKTKLSGFQDMECIPCGDPPPPYEPHCSGRVNLVPIPSTVTSPRDMALAAVICSALATVLLALLILCVIYCKRQLLEKKPASLRSQDSPFTGAELSCLDRRRVLDFSQRPCCHCHHMPGQTCAGPVHLIPSLCCEDTCSQGPAQDNSPFQSQSSLNESLLTGATVKIHPPFSKRMLFRFNPSHVNPSVMSSQGDLGQAPDPLLAEFSEAWPLTDAAESRNHASCSSQPTKNSSSCSLEEEEEEENKQEEHSYSLVSTKPTSEVLRDGCNLSETSLLSQQHASTLEG
ncbi:tumor necrosis factor receptor superfamily member 19 isoform X1 [Pygocentrus nattereri]|uniref:tumor necrosis factor receptor superfamily member 19 isoform X1 n=1 Tax=Pygocentrus nattereri TaxID=42514 RepID=UPI0008146F79|nr:tumor necrosis factor receptor superfamily member 19 isoform X1 [Pygocentrus nattereri]